MFIHNINCLFSSLCSIWILCLFIVGCFARVTDFFRPKLFWLKCVYTLILWGHVTRVCHIKIPKIKIIHLMLCVIKYHHTFEMRMFLIFENCFKKNNGWYFNVGNEIVFLWHFCYYWLIVLIILLSSWDDIEVYPLNEYNPTNVISIHSQRMQIIKIENKYVCFYTFYNRWKWFI